MSNNYLIITDAMSYNNNKYTFLSDLYTYKGNGKYTHEKSENNVYLYNLNHSNNLYLKGVTFNGCEVYISDLNEIIFKKYNKVYNEIYLPRIQTSILGSYNKDDDATNTTTSLPPGYPIDLSGIMNPGYPDVSDMFVTPKTLEVECQHEWKDYVGLFETYRYCSKCDVKG